VAAITLYRQGLCRTHLLRDCCGSCAGLRRGCDCRAHVGLPPALALVLLMVVLVPPLQPLPPLLLVLRGGRERLRLLDVRWPAASLAVHGPQCRRTQATSAASCCTCQLQHTLAVPVQAGGVQHGVCAAVHARLCRGVLRVGGDGPLVGRAVGCTVLVSGP
jgi:hypothetical protein